MRQRRSEGLSLLAPQCEDCMWEEAGGEGEQEKEGEQERKRAGREKAVCLVCKEAKIHLKVCECVAL